MLVPTDQATGSSSPPRYDGWYTWDLNGVSKRFIVYFGILLAVVLA